MTTDNQTDEINMVRDLAQMHDKFGVNAAVRKLSVEHKNLFLRFRLDFTLEELKETYKAAGYTLLADVQQVDIPSNLTLADADEVVDGLIDITYVAVGTLDALDVKTKKAWGGVHDANMAKEVGIKPGRPNPLGLPDLIKPAGWTAPSHMDNLGLLPTMFGQPDDESKE